MYEFDDPRDMEPEFFNQESAVLEALSKVDRGLFDAPDSKDEDLEALFEN